MVNVRKTTPPITPGHRDVVIADDALAPSSRPWRSITRGLSSAARGASRWHMGGGIGERSLAPGERRHAQKPALVFLAVGALARGRLAGGEWRGRRPALLEVLVGLRFLLFLVAAHLTLGHDDLPCARLKRLGAVARLSKPPRFVCGNRAPPPREVVSPGRAASADLMKPPPFRAVRTCRLHFSN